MQDYFKRLPAEGGGTHFWINNPSMDEVKKAQEQGAFACTTNPAYCSRLISVETDYINEVIDEQIKNCSDYDELAAAVYRECGRRLMQSFLPQFESTGGKSGFVTMQDDPRVDMDTAHTVENIEKNRALAPNYMAKIPVINGGIEAIQECVRLNVPICATEVFAVSQALTIAEKYEEAAKKYGNHPAMFITHISGIFDEYLKKTVKREGIDIAPEVIDKAGIAAARRQFALLRENGFDFTMLGGGARGVHHFTGLVGGPNITINWSTAQEMLDGDYSVKCAMDEEIEQAVIDELCRKLPDFEKAYNVGGLAVDEFADFGPVQLFRNSFLKGWYALLSQIATRKHLFAL